MTDSGGGHEVRITLVKGEDGGGMLVRVDYGNDTGGRYIIAPYDRLQEWVISKRPRAELLDLYPSLRVGN